MRGCHQRMSKRSKRYDALHVQANECPCQRDARVAFEINMSIVRLLRVCARAACAAAAPWLPGSPLQTTIKDKLNVNKTDQHTRWSGGDAN